MKLVLFIFTIIYIASSANAIAQEDDRYEVSITKHIIQHQKYPTSGKLYGLEGDVIIRVQINSTGKIVSHKIIHQAKHEILNQAINDMIKNANPAPTPPASYFANGEELIEFMIPIAFRKQENSTNLEEIDYIFQERSREAWK